MLSQHPFGFSASTKPWGITRTECLGSRGAQYYETPEIDAGKNIWSGNLKSISAMQFYKDKSHEELRLEDYELLKVKAQGFSFPSQSAFLQSSPLFGPLTSPVLLSRQPSFRSLCGTTSATSTASLVSDSSVKPPFGSTSTGVGPFPFGGSASDGFVDRDPRNSAFETSRTNMFSATNNLTPSSSVPRTNTCCGCMYEGEPSVSALEVSKTPVFGITSTPLPWSSLSNAGSSNNPVSTTSGFSFGTTSASGSSSTFGIQNSSGFQGTTSTKYQGSRPGFSATAEIASNKAYPVGNIQSISAMPFYEDKSHEELRLEDYAAYVQPTFGSVSTVSGPFPLGGSTGDGFAIRDPKTSGFETSSTNMFSAPNNSTPTSSAFCISSANSSLGKSTFRFPCGCLYEGPHVSSFNVSKTPGFGITLTPLSCSMLSSGVSFLSATSNNPGSTTAGFNVGSTSASESSSIYGIQTSSGSHGTISTNYQGSRPGFSATAERADYTNFDGNIQSISAMPIYEDKSHGELKSEDYGLCNTCYKGERTHWGAPFCRSSCLKTSDIPSNIFSVAPLSNKSSVPSPFQPSNSNLSELKRDNSMTPSNSVSTAPTLSPPENPLCCTNMYHAQPQAFTPTTVPFMTSFTQNLNPPSLLPSTEPMVKSSCQCPNISTTFTSVSAPLSNQFTVHSPFQPLKSNFSVFKTENLMTPRSKMSTAPTLSPYVNPFSSTDEYRSPQAQAFTQPATASFGPTFTSNLNLHSLIPFTDPMLRNGCECPKVSTTFTISSVLTFSFTEPSVIASSSIKFNPVTSSDLSYSTVNASQPQQTSEKVGPLSTNELNTQASSGLTAETQFTSQNINAPQYNASTNSSTQSSLVVNPFVTRFPTNQPNVETSRLHGISSLPVSDNLSQNRRASLLRLRHVSSRYPGLPTLKPNGRSSETKVPFFIDEEDKTGPVTPSLARENPRALINISSLSHHSSRDSKGDEVQDSSSSLQVIERVSEDVSALLNQHEDEVDAKTERLKADVVALLPKLPDGEEYYTEPSLLELAKKEMAEAGFCGHVEDFVVGRQGYGSIKFVGETDIRHLDIESIVQLKNRQVIVYPDGRKKPGVGEELNKAAEVTLLNVKCINKKTGEKYVEGHQVENYKESLIKKAEEEGAEFVSYDPVKGEWKFRVQHF